MGRAWIFQHRSKDSTSFPLPLPLLLLAGHATDNPSLPLQLATASFDCTVKLWDPLKGKELFVLGEHAEPVYTVGFCPDGTLLATGSYDRTVKIWSAKTGKIIATFLGEGGVFEVSWDKVQGMRDCNPEDLERSCSSDMCVNIYIYIYSLSFSVWGGRRTGRTPCRCFFNGQYIIDI